MSGTATPAPPQREGDAFAVEFEKLAAAAVAPQGEPPADQPEPAPSEPERGAEAAGEQIAQEAEPTAPPAGDKPPEQDWEARLRQLEQKHEHDRRALAGRIKAAEDRAAEAQRALAARQQQEEAQVANLRDEARRQGNTADEQYWQAELTRRQVERREAALAGREQSVGQTQQQLAALVAEQRRRETPAIFAGAVAPLLSDLRAEFEDIDHAQLERDLGALVASEGFRRRAASIDPLADPQRFADLQLDLWERAREKAQGQRDRRAEEARANRARDAETGRYVAEGSGPGGAAPPDPAQFRSTPEHKGDHFDALWDAHYASARR